MTDRSTKSHLRQLAVDYAEGRICRDAYLAARKQFLDALGAQQPEPARASADTTTPEPAQQTRPRLPYGRLIALALSLLALLVVGVILAALYLRIALPAPPPPVSHAAASTPPPGLLSANGCMLGSLPDLYPATHADLAHAYS